MGKTQTIVLKLETTNQYEVDKSVWRMEAILIGIRSSSSLWLAFVMCVAHVRAAKVCVHPATNFVL